MEIKTKDGVITWVPGNIHYIRSKFKYELAVLDGLAKHILVSDYKIVAKEKSSNDMQGRFVELTGAGYVLHMDIAEQHEPIELQKGIYHFYPQIEYNPFSEEISRVFD